MSLLGDLKGQDGRRGQAGGRGHALGLAAVGAVQVPLLHPNSVCVLPLRSTDCGPLVLSPNVTAGSTKT